MREWMRFAAGFVLALAAFAAFAPAEWRYVALSALEAVAGDPVRPVAGGPAE